MADNMTTISSPSPLAIAKAPAVDEASPAQALHRMGAGDSTEPLDLLGELLADLVYHRPMNPVTRHWLTRGVLDAIRRNEPLDRCLALAQVGSPAIQSRLMMLRRNDHLVLAVAAVSLDEQQSAWSRYQALAPRIGRFMNSAWPASRGLSAPPDDWPEFKKQLWFAACCGFPLPTSPTGLYRALDKDGGYPRSNGGAKILEQFL